MENNIATPWLENLLHERVKTNPQFSLRAFARMVNVSPAVLSRILSGKRKLTFSLATRIADALALAPDQRIFSTNYTCATSSDLSVDCFTAMKDWYHYAITQLILLEEFREDHKWIAKMLGISELESKIAIDRLLKLEVLDRDVSGNLFKTNMHLATSTEIAASGIKHFQKEILKKAMQALDSTDSGERNISSLTIAINENNLAEAKKEIRRFKQRMSELLTSGDKTRVYNLGVHLFPLSKTSNEE